MNPKKIIRKVVPKSALKLVEKGYRKGRGLSWQARYGFPARGVRVIAVTGTNGKSTTCAYINEVLKAGGLKTAVLTTVFYEVAGKREPNRTHYTIDRQSIVQNFFAKAKRANVDWVILEVTSHALDQYRIQGVKVDVAVITNLSQEHLDYHKTMENYATAKAQLLTGYGAKWAVLNADNEWYEFFRERSTAEVVSVGKVAGANAKISNLSVSPQGTKFALTTDSMKLELSTKMIGEYNAYNATQAATVGVLLKLKKSEIEEGIANLKRVEGRMDEVKTDKDFQVFIDYAVTPDAIEDALKALKAISKGNVRIVFGATGDRDQQKRGPMGEVAAKNADFIYLTDDETYSEDPDTIRNAVFEGIRASGGAEKTKTIEDRGEAIETALKDAKVGDCVLITGLGHEDSRNMGGQLIPWSDRTVAEKYLEK